MKNFRYSAVDNSGRLHSGQVMALDEDDARSMIWAMQLSPLEVIAQNESFLSFFSKIKKDESRLDDAKLAALARDISVLLLGGLTLERSLTVIKSSLTEESLQKSVASIRHSLLEGASFSKAFEPVIGSDRADCFNIIRVGDLSGRSGAALRQIAELIDRRIETRSRIKKALAYPAFLLVMSIVAMTVVVGFLLPAIMPLFVDNGVPLPAVLHILDSLSKNIDLISGASILCLCSFMALFFYARRHPAAKLAVARIFLKRKPFGSFISMRDGSRFIRTLAALMQAGVPLVEAFESSIPSVKNSFMKQRLQTFRVDLRQGVPLSEIFGRESLFPAAAAQMSLIGEETGELPSVLERTADLLEKLERQKLDTIIAALGPAVTTFIAGLVGAVVMAIMSGVMAVNDLVGK